MTAPTDARVEARRIMARISQCCTHAEVTAVASAERDALSRLGRLDALAAIDVRNLAAQRRMWIDRGWVKPGQPEVTPYEGPQPGAKRLQSRGAA